jgi:trk system potassium uptake protein TrkA
MFSFTPLEERLMEMKVLIVGGGKVGTHLAQLLMGWGHQVKLIEIRRELIPRLANILPPEVVVCGSGTDPAVLESTEVKQVDIVAAVTGADETNLIVAGLSRFEFAVPRTIIRVNNPKNVWLCTPEMGVDVGLSQADLMAHLIAEEMSLGDMMTLLKLRKGQYALVEEKVHPGASAAGKPISSLPLPRECVITAIIREGHLIIPRGETVLQPADEVLAVIHSEDTKQLAKLLDEI